MAEVLGVAAGVVGISSFAGQIAEGAIKLKNFCSRIKKADEELLILSDDLYHFSAVLEQVEAQYAQTFVLMPMPSYLVQCHQSCGVLVVKLQAVIQKLNFRSLDPKISDRVKFALRRDSLKELRDALTKASQPLMIGMLSFSNVTIIKTYQQTLKLHKELEDALISFREGSLQDSLLTGSQSLDHEMTARRSDPQIIDGQYGEVECRRSTGQLSPGKRSSLQQDSVTTRYRFVSAWLKMGWSIERGRASQGWHFTFRMYHTVSKKSLVFEYARKGDIAGLRVLFEAKLASPFDIDSTYGWTPLHYAANSDEANTVRFLIENDADVNARDWDGESCFDAFWRITKRGCIANEKNPLNDIQVSETIRLLGSRWDGLFSSDDNLLTSLTLWSGDNRYADLDFVRKSIYPSYEDTPLTNRLMVCLLAYEGEWRSVDVIPSLLGQCRLNNLSFDEFCSIWLLAFYMLGLSRNHYHVHLQFWRRILEQLVSAHPHYIRETDLSMAFQLFIHQAPSIKANDEASSGVERFWQEWIQELVIAGVDINEHADQISQCFFYHNRILNIKVGRNKMVRVKIIKVKCSNNISDCKLWLSWPLDEWAGEFWNSLENPGVSMPGGWPDGVDSDDRRIYSYSAKGEVKSAFDLWYEAVGSPSPDPKDLWAWLLHLFYY